MSFIMSRNVISIANTQPKRYNKEKTNKVENLRTITRRLRMKKKIGNGWLALLLMVSVVFADMMPSLALTVQAAQEESALQGMAAGTSVTAETSGGEVPSTQEKQLVQCSNDWTIFRSVNDGIPSFELYYMDKTPEELEEEGFLIKYRIIDTSSTSRIYTWKDFNNELSDELQNSSNYTNLIQFLIARNSNSVLSDALSILPRNNPYILAATFSTYPELSPWVGYYPLTAYPNTFKLTLKVSENLSGDNVSVSIDANGLDSYLIGSYSASNLSYENKTETYTIQNKNYTLKYSEVTLDVQVASKANSSNAQYSSNYCFIVYNFNFPGLKGIESHNQLIAFSIGTELPVEKNTSVESITINANRDYVIVGNNIKLSAIIAPSDATDKSVTWSSSNTEYATVDEYGFVTAKEAGIGKTVIITATANDGSGVTGTCTLTIVGATDNTPVKEIAINAPSSTVKPGNKVALSATVAPSDATDKNVTWSSSNSAYATVDANGVVTANAAGAGKSVVITATANDGSGVSGTYTLYIETIPVTGITIKGSATSVTVGNKVNLSATVAPGNATNSGITWSSSNTAYATVDANGVVTTKAAGAGKSVVITATANDGSGVKSTFNINIKKVNVTKISLSTTTKTVQAGKKATVKAAIAPTNATNKAITWTSSNKKYATVNSKGVVTTKKAGIGKTVTITAKAKDGSGKKSSIKIKIVKTVKVSKIKLTTSSKTVKAGKKVTVKAAITPVNATNKKVTWTSSNKDYATVNSKGVVTTKKAGKGKTVTITAKAKDGSGKKATIKIKIR